MTKQTAALLGAFLLREREALLANWRLQVRQLPSARRLDVPTLNDHLPKLIDELATALAEGSERTHAEGGRHTPFFKGSRPQVDCRTTDVTGACEPPAGGERVMPGDNGQMTIELSTPIAMDAGLRFAIREGGRTVGAGVVTKILK